MLVATGDHDNSTVCTDPKSIEAVLKWGAMDLCRRGEVIRRGEVFSIIDNADAPLECLENIFQGSGHVTGPEDDDPGGSDDDKVNTLFLHVFFWYTFCFGNYSDLLCSLGFLHIRGRSLRTCNKFAQ